MSSPDNYGAQYPGSPIYGQPPATGIANRTPITPGPATGTANYANPTPAAPAVGKRNKVRSYSQTPAVSAPNYGTVPPVAPIGVPNRTPLLTPIGTSPHYKTPNEVWEYDYGNGGDGSGVPGP